MKEILEKLGLEPVNSGVYHGEWVRSPHGPELVSYNPTTGKEIARVLQAGPEDYEQVVGKAHEAFLTWRMIPAPKRGEIVRQIGLELRRHKRELAALVSLEMGKIRIEGEGEVQEMIDICDFSVGLSRQLYGLTIQSERPMHRMFEQWHPLGIVGIISAFNFPVAVWSWNAAIAAVCGDSMIWKPSSETPLTAVATHNIINRVMAANGFPGVMCLCIGKGSTVGELMNRDKRIPLISATGSTDMGRRIAVAVGERLGRTILELGGNNAIIISAKADLKLALRAVLFAAIGTAGQRCTTTRRIFLHRSIAAEFIDRLAKAYATIRIGDPLEEGTLMGPLVNKAGVSDMMQALEIVKQQGGEIVYGGKRLTHGHYAAGCFVEPTLVRIRANAPIVHEETFAPILYVLEYDDLEQALADHNAVPQGLSSAIFTDSVREAELFLSPRGSDCGIANVNIGTSGAEIGGAFGGEKETGGGRESGSDCWKAYMRRQTNTVNWGTELPLAQGIVFGD